MKHLFILIIFALGFTTCVRAQSADSSAEQRLAGSAQAANAVSYNAVRLIPRLHWEHKMDSVKTIVDDWEKTGTMEEPLFSYLIISEIKDGTFDEKLYKHTAADSMANTHAYRVDYYKRYILPYLRRYMYGCDIRNNPRRYILHDTSRNVVAAYGNYYDFLQSLALPLCDSPHLEAAARFLVHFYAHPDTGMFRDLKSPYYKGTEIRDIYRQKDEKMPDEIRGLTLELTVGSWMPQGHLGAVQSSVLYDFGFKVGGRSNKLMYGLNILYGTGSPTNPMYVKDNNTLYPAQVHGADYVAIDWGYQLMRKNNREIDLLLGTGTSLFDAAYDSSKTKDFYSLDINAGLGYKLYCLRNKSITLEAKYHLLNYRNPGGTSISGNAITIGFVFELYAGRYPGFGRDMAAGFDKALFKE